MVAWLPFGFRRTLCYRIFDLGLIFGLFFIARSMHVYQVPWEYLGAPLVALAIGQVVAFESIGAYRCLTGFHIGSWCLRAVAGWLITLGILLGVLYALKTSDRFPRTVIGSWALSVAALLVVGRCVGYAVIRSGLRRGRGRQRALLVGHHGYCRRLAKHLDANPALGVHPVGICADERFGDGQGDRFPVLGGIQQLPDLLAEYEVGRVIVSAPIQDQSTIFEVFAQLVRMPVVVQYAPDLSRFSLIGFRGEDYAGQPVFSLTAPPLTAAQHMSKLIEDKILGVLCLLLAVPVLLVCAVLVKLSSPGPVFFVQERHGALGRPIRVIKFRTMRSDASAEAAGGTETTDSGRFRQATAGDSRVTWVGNLLRKTSLDELPQLFNVLKGDMSLVGPRPHPIKLNEQFTESIDELMRRHYMKPGITGLAQINGCRGETATIEDMRRRLAYDLEYLRSWSLWLDLRILLLTPLRGLFNLQP